VLLSSFPEDGIPLVVFDDFSIDLEKPYATDFTSLLASFDLKWLITTGIHKSGNQLDLVYTRNCITDNILVKPLYVSDHFLITFSLQLTTHAPPIPLPVTFRRNLYTVSPSLLSSDVSSSVIIQALIPAKLIINLVTFKSYNKSYNVHSHSPPHFSDGSYAPG